MASGWSVGHGLSDLVLLPLACPLNQDKLVVTRRRMDDVAQLR